MLQKTEQMVADEAAGYASAQNLRREQLEQAATRATGEHVPVEPILLSQPPSKSISVIMRTVAVDK